MHSNIVSVRVHWIFQLPINIFLMVLHSIVFAGDSVIPRKFLSHVGSISRLMSIQLLSYFVVIIR